MIRKLEDMCHDLNFNKDHAVNLMKQVDLNQEFERNPKFGFTYTTTLQVEAIHNYNIDMLSLLLENGADPNQIYYEVETALWDLQYDDGETDEENEIRLKMAELLLKYGANPNINPEDEPEDLFEWVWFELCHEGYDDSWKYMSRFFILLVAYGGKAKNWEPKLLPAFDKRNATTKYSFFFLDPKTDDYDAAIFDEEDNIVAYI